MCACICQYIAQALWVSVLRARPCLHIVYRWYRALAYQLHYCVVAVVLCDCVFECERNKMFVCFRAFSFLHTSTNSTATSSTQIHNVAIHYIRTSICSQSSTFPSNQIQSYQLLGTIQPATCCCSILCNRGTISSLTRCCVFVHIIWQLYHRCIDRPLERFALQHTKRSPLVLLDWRLFHTHEKSCCKSTRSFWKLTSSCLVSWLLFITCAHKLGNNNVALHFISVVCLCLWNACSFTRTRTPSLHTPLLTSTIYYN